MNEKIKARQVSVEEIEFELASFEAKSKQFPDMVEYKEQAMSLSHIVESLRNETPYNGPDIVWVDLDTFSELKNEH
jgi:hypothetical protein